MQQSEKNLRNTGTDWGASSQEMLEVLEQQDKMIAMLKEENEKLRIQQSELMNLLDEYLKLDAGKLQKENMNLKKCLERAEADSFCEMIQRRFAEKLIEKWKALAEGQAKKCM